MQFFEDRSDAACRVVIRNLPWALPQRVTFLPIGEICYCILGRGGAERSECPLTRAASRLFPSALLFPPIFFCALHFLAHCLFLIVNSRYLCGVPRWWGINLIRLV